MLRYKLVLFSASNINTGPPCYISTYPAEQCWVDGLGHKSRHPQKWWCIPLCPEDEAFGGNKRSPPVQCALPQTHTLHMNQSTNQVQCDILGENLILYLHSSYAITLLPYTYRDFTKTYSRFIYNHCLKFPAKIKSSSKSKQHIIKIINWMTMKLPNPI